MGRGNLRLVGATRPRTRAMERRADETEADRAAREYVHRLTAPLGRLGGDDFRNDSRGETHPIRVLARRLRRARMLGVPIAHAIEETRQLADDLVVAVYCEVIDQRGPRPTAPGAARKAA